MSILLNNRNNGFIPIYGIAEVGGLGKLEHPRHYGDVKDVTKKNMGMGFTLCIRQGCQPRKLPYCTEMLQY